MKHGPEGFMMIRARYGGFWFLFFLDFFVQHSGREKFRARCGLQNGGF